MKLVLINGSPRYKKSNSQLLINQFLKGYNKRIQEPVPIYYLANNKQKDEAVEAYQKADATIVFFPLYADSMPGIVKEFFENIASLKLSGTKKIGFVLHSGFPEAIHSVYLERYLEKFTKRIRCEYLGTIIRGGTEGIKVMPFFMTMSLYRNFRNLGKYFAQHTAFSNEIRDDLRKFYKLTPAALLLFHVLKRIGLLNVYWDVSLIKNGAFKKRSDRPLVSGSQPSQSEVFQKSA